MIVDYKNSFKIRKFIYVYSTQFLVVFILNSELFILGN